MFEDVILKLEKIFSDEVQVELTNAEKEAVDEKNDVYLKYVLSQPDQSI